MVKDGNQLIWGLDKTSDNMLSLIKVGDLVEYKKSDYYNIELVTRCYYNKQGVETLAAFVYEEEITAIFKRQINGDYKHYEVKK